MKNKNIRSLYHINSLLQNLPIKHLEQSFSTFKSTPSVSALKKRFSGIKKTLIYKLFKILTVLYIFENGIF